MHDIKRIEPEYDARPYACLSEMRKMEPAHFPHAFVIELLGAAEEMKLSEAGLLAVIAGEYQGEELPAYLNYELARLAPEVIGAIYP